MLESLKMIIAKKIIYQNELKKVIKKASDYEIIQNSIVNLPLLIEKVTEGIDKNKILPENCSIIISAISYVFNPFDIIPEDKYGLLGYLDDCYIFYKIVSENIPVSYLNKIKYPLTTLNIYSKICYKYIPSQYKKQIDDIIISLNQINK